MAARSPRSHARPNCLAARCEAESAPAPITIPTTSDSAASPLSRGTARWVRRLRRSGEVSISTTGASVARAHAATAGFQAPGNVRAAVTGLDWVIVGFTLLMATWGYAQGLIVGALSLAGFGVGALIGSRVAPALLTQGSH